jgi:hypothetical protein
MPADLASNAAAVAEGYVRTQTDRGATANPRYFTRYERATDGDLQSGFTRLVDGYSNVDQATADATALASLNGLRRSIFGTDTAVNKGPRSGQALVPAKN